MGILNGYAILIMNEVNPVTYECPSLDFWLLWFDRFKWLQPNKKFLRCPQPGNHWADFADGDAFASKIGTKKAKADADVKKKQVCKSVN